MTNLVSMLIFGLLGAWIGSTGIVGCGPVVVLAWPPIRAGKPWPWRRRFEGAQ